MTQSIIEKLEALPRHDISPDPTIRGEFVYYDDLRAIIEDAKAEKQDATHKGYYHEETDTPVSIGQWNGLVKKFANDPDDLKTILAMPKLYTTPQPDIVAELVKALEDADELIGIEPYEHVAQEAADAHRNIRELVAKAKGMM